jgi:hypothetical protein
MTLFGRHRTNTFAQVMRGLTDFNGASRVRLSSIAQADEKFPVPTALR